jgi:peptide methionine sulfoxide reductase MsrB
MSPQEIVNATATARERMLAVVRQETHLERDLLAKERARIQGLCAEHTGHVFGLGRWPSTGRFCVYCELLAPSSAGEGERCEA